MFIAIEGIDGVGKTTIARHLVNWINEDSCSSFEKAHYTFAPGDGSATGLAIRTVMLNHGPERNPVTTFYLAMAARSEQYYSIRDKLLEPRNLVVTDRFDLSTIAYQYASGLLDVRNRIRKLDFPEPSIPYHYFLLTGKNRRSPDSDNDLFDSADAEYKKNVKTTFLSTNTVYYKNTRVPVHHIDTTVRTEYDITRKILQILGDY